MGRSGGQTVFKAGLKTARKKKTRKRSRGMPAPPGPLPAARGGGGPGPAWPAAGSALRKIGQDQWQGAAGRREGRDWRRSSADPGGTLAGTEWRRMLAGGGMLGEAGGGFRGGRRVPGWGCGRGRASHKPGLCARIKCIRTGKTSRGGTAERARRSARAGQPERDKEQGGHERRQRQSPGDRLR